MWLAAYPCEAFLPLTLLHLRDIFTPALLWSAVCVAREWCLTSGMDFLVVALWFLGAVQLWVPDVQVSNIVSGFPQTLFSKQLPKSCPPHLHFLCSTMPFQRPWVSCVLDLGSHSFDKQPSKFIAFFLIPLYFYFLFAVFNSPVQSRLIKLSINRLWLAFKVL